MEIAKQAHELENEVLTAVRDFAKTVDSKYKVVSDMSSLVAATNKLNLSGLEYWERLIRDEFDRALGECNRRGWKFGDNPTQILTWLDLISWNGYKRESTLRTLAGKAPNSFFFALALRRLNDWVPDVREAARHKLPILAEASEPSVVAEAMCVTLANWNSWGRIQERDRAVLLTILEQRKIGQALNNTIISSTSGPMSSLLSQIGRTPVLDEYLGEIAQSAVQPSVRAKAYRCQFEQRMVWLEGRKFVWTDKRYCEGKVMPIIGERKIQVKTEFGELLRQSAADSSSIVRRVSAEMLIRDLPNADTDTAKYAAIFAADKSNAVAERGLFALKKLAERSC